MNNAKTTTKLNIEIHNKSQLHSVPHNETPQTCT